ncbi:type II toxin-antitoxin system RatA family toxin [Sorangium sp. So ce1182]|uniref:type II toxin-antitoxin system RatA family toxin n=1 Tax=Sorangium sp. So ce1182 TaxID=3133334 RepID=UPI003F60D9EA
MKKWWSLSLIAFSLALLALSPRPARAADAESEKLASLGKALRYTLKTSGPTSAIDTGGAAILVKAPLSTVRKLVTSYGSYKTFISSFDQSRVLSKRKGTSEVYLQVPILNGAAHIWTVADMSPPAKDGADEVISGRYKRGNVSDFRARWRLRAVDEHHTILKLELFVAPKLPFPPSVVTSQLVRAADKAVTAVRDRAEARPPASARATSASTAAPDASPRAAASATASSGPSPAAQRGEQSSPPAAPAAPAAGVPPLPPTDDESVRRHEDMARR